jgi:hypothetical protein
MTTAGLYSYSLDLTPDDYRQFYNAIGRHQGKPPKWIYPAAISVSIPVAIVLASFTRLRAFDIGVSCVIAFLLGMVAMIVVIQLLHAGAMRRLALIGAEDWTRYSVRIDDDGVDARGEGIAIQGRWSTVMDVTIEQDGLMIWLGRLQAVRIPERAFVNVAERDAVAAFVRSRMTA